MLRIENKTPDQDIPYEDYPDKSIFIHGSTTTRAWRTRFLTEMNSASILVLDAWKNSWSSYTGALSDELEAFDDLSSQAIAGGSEGPGGIVDGYTPMVIPDIENFSFFWENRAVKNTDFQFFNLDSPDEIASHIVVLLSAAIKKDPTKVIVRIPKTDWRSNFVVFLKFLPRENYFGLEENAFERIKVLMDI